MEKKDKKTGLIDLTGQIFGKTEVLYRSEKNGPSRGAMWVCRCECGNIRTASSQNLRSYNSKSCHKCRYKREIAYGSMWNQIVSSAKARGIKFKIQRKKTFKILQDQNNRCALSGLDINIAESHRSHVNGGSTASLDRINSKKYYSYNNIIWVDKRINKMKGSFTLERFLEICKLVSNKANGIIIDIEDEPELLEYPDPPESPKNFSTKNRRDLTGMTFGYYKVIRLLKERDKGSRVWECQCRCGTIKNVIAKRLTSKNLKMCIKCSGKRHQKVAFNSRWHRIIHGAKIRNIPFNLDKEKTFKLLEDQKYRCTLSGQKIVIAKSRKSDCHGETTASLDRIDSSLDYSESNVIWVHTDINLCKSTLPMEEFIYLCNTITKYQEGKNGKTSQ